MAREVTRYAPEFRRQMTELHRAGRGEITRLRRENRKLLQ